MTRITWGDTGHRFFSTGVDRGVLFLQNGSGVPWNGLVSVNEAPSGSDAVEAHFDGKKYHSRRSPEEFSGTIEAYTYPSEFEIFLGQAVMHTAQARTPFNFTYRTRIGNDENGVDHAYLIHIVYNALIKPTQRALQTISDSIDVATFSWDFETNPLRMGDRRGSHLIIDSRLAYPWALEELETILYGSTTTTSTLPSPEFLLQLFEDASILKVTNHGDGTVTIEGPDDIVKMIGTNLWQIGPWPSVIQIAEHTYRASSL